MKSEPGRSSDGKMDLSCSVEDGRKIYNIADEAIAVVAEMGVSIPDRPTYEVDHEELFQGVHAGMYFDGRMPTVVRRLELDQLSNLYALLQAWYGYLFGQLGEWKIRKSQTKAISDNTNAFLRELYKSRGNSEQSSRDLAKHDHRFVEDLAEHEKADAVYSLIEAAVKTASKNLELISREITVRGMQIDADGRGRGFNRRFGQAARMEDERPRGYQEGGVGNVETTGVVPPGQGNPGGNSRAPQQGQRRSRWG